MMNKKIADYLPYYIGQDVFYLNNEPAVLSEISLDSKYSTLVSVKFTKGVKRHFQCKISDIKLRLRPLSSMTDEEAIFYASLHRNMDGFAGNVFVKPGNNSDTHIEFFSGSWGMSLFVGGEKSSYKPAAFHYLLKQGFDLFGLIEAGLAVDKTKEVPHGND